jgi:Zn-dependent membrane protease YugP
MSSYWILLIVVAGASFWVQWKLRSKFQQYSQLAFRGNLTGAQVAAKMLHDNDINDVKIVSVEGQLTDHFNPMDKTVNLSPEVYHGRSVMAAAIAAHECGHAVQYARAYAWIGMRSALVPAVSFASRWVQWVIMAGILLLAFTGAKLGFWVLLAGVVLFGLTTLFSFVTLPVEFDASNRALVWLEGSGMTNPEEHNMAKDALKWAAMTYVVAAIASLLTLLYYVSMLMGGRRRD